MITLDVYLAACGCSDAESAAQGGRTLYDFDWIDRRLTELCRHMGIGKTEFGGMPQCRSLRASKRR